MNLFQQNLHPVILDTELSLKALINKLIISSAIIGEKNRSSIVNNIESSFLLKENSSNIVSIIEELLVTVLSNAHNSKIYITAEKYKDIIMLNIQDRNNNNGYAMAFSVMTVEQQVTEAGGFLTIEGKQSKVATVSFSFPNLAAAC